MSAVHPSDYDRSQPRVGIILATTLVTVFALVVFKLLFDSYFDSVVNEEKLVKTDTKFLRDMQSHRAEARAKVNEASVPISDTFRRIEVEGRAQQTAIVPKESSDDGARLGWAHRKAGPWELGRVTAAEDASGHEAEQGAGSGEGDKEEGAARNEATSSKASGTDAEDDTSATEKAAKTAEDA